MNGSFLFLKDCELTVIPWLLILKQLLTFCFVIESYYCHFTIFFPSAKALFFYSWFLCALAKGL